MGEAERRFTSSPVELRSAEGGGQRIGGYAARFLRYSEDMGGWRERIAPSAFNKSRGDGWPKVVCRYNHNPDMILGTTQGGTLSLSIDATGLAYEVLPPVTRADVLELVQRGDVSQSSFAFQRGAEGSDEWDLAPDGTPRRTLISVKLIDVAPVWSPAYADTSVGLRSLAEHVGAPLAEVRRLAAAHRLRSLLARSDVPGRPSPAHVPSVRTPAQRLSYLASRRHDPWA